MHGGYKIVDKAQRVFFHAPMVTTGLLHQARNPLKSTHYAPGKALRFPTCVGRRLGRHGGRRLRFCGVYLDAPTLNGGYTIVFRGRGDGVGGRLPGAGSG